MRFMHKAVLSAASLGILAGSPVLAGDAIRPIEVFTRPQASQPQEFQSVQLIAQEWRKKHWQPWQNGYKKKHTAEKKYRLSFKKYHGEFLKPYK